MKDIYGQIIEDLAILRDSRRRFGIFGEEAHGYCLNPPLGFNELVQFERCHGITLPSEYRDFLLKVGNGGAGPSYGLFRLGEMDGTSTTYEPWSADCIGSLAEPWPHQTIWNNLEGQPPEDCEDDDAQDAFDAHYFHTSLVNGAFPICHIGCALREWLVISGPERGNVWYDARPDLAGIHPLKDASGNRLSFLAWYRQWLDEALGQLQK